MTITLEQAAKVLSIIDAGLTSGLGEPIPGKMCVEAAVCFALGEPHSDRPSCVAPALQKFKIALNDGNWKSNTSRAVGLRKLALLQLGTKDSLNEIEFSSKLGLLTVTKLLAQILDERGMLEHSRRCRDASSLKEAAEAAEAAWAARAARAAVWAAEAAGAARAARAAARAARAARAAAWAARAAPEKYLVLSAEIASQILIEMNVPGVQFLPLLSGGSSLC